MNLKDVSKWNARVALVYAVGVWTLLGATIYTHMESQARKKDDAEHTEDDPNDNEEKQATSTNFLPHSMGLLNNLKILTGGSGSTAGIQGPEK